MIRILGWVALVYAILVVVGYGYACWHYSPEAWRLFRDLCQRIAFHTGRAGIFAENRINELGVSSRG